MNFVDPYAFRARIQPALIVVLPLGLLVLVILSAQPLLVTALFGFLGATVGGTVLVAHLGRERGYRKQFELWERWGGRPTVRLLRHRRTPGDDELSPGLRQQIEDWTGLPLPTRQEEEAWTEWADGVYGQAVGLLIAATRDTTTFPLVFAENVNYGFRRNLWGLKLYGVGISAVLAIIFLIQLFLTIWGRPWPDPWWGIFVNPDIVVATRIMITLIDVALLTSWLFCIKPLWVKAADDEYARRLLESAWMLNRPQP